MLGHDIAAALPTLRAQAESLMVDACIIERPTGETTIDPDTLAEVRVYESVYEGKCRIQRSAALRSQETSPGGYEFGVGTVIAQVPLSALGVNRGQRLTVTAVSPITDPDMLGLVATVGANLTKTHPTKRTLICEGVSQ